ncbi:MAG: hypothetical protein QM751_12550 [Paludibacteraceae bacterium]
MKRIDELLEKYIAGTTSLPEEKELKTYFNSNEVKTEHKRYLPLFMAFQFEKETIAPILPDSNYKKNIVPTKNRYFFNRNCGCLFTGADGLPLPIFKRKLYDCERETHQQF